MYTPIPGSNHSSVIMQITTLPRLSRKYIHKCKDIGNHKSIILNNASSKQLHHIRIAFLYTDSMNMMGCFFWVSPAILC